MAKPQRVQTKKVKNPIIIDPVINENEDTSRAKKEASKPRLVDDNTEDVGFFFRKKKDDNATQTNIKEAKNNRNLSELENLKLELETLKSALKASNNGERKLNAQEKKIITAIKTEALIQKRNDPILSTTKLRKIYKVSSRYLMPSLDYLIGKNMIERREVVYSGKVTTFSYRIIEL